MSEPQHSKPVLIIVTVLGTITIIMGGMMIIDYDATNEANWPIIGIGLLTLGIAMIVSGVLSKRAKKVARGLNIGIGCYTVLGGLGMFAPEPSFEPLYYTVIILTGVFGTITIIRELVSRKKQPVSFVHYGMSALMLGISFTMIVSPQTDNFLSVFYLGLAAILTGSSGVLVGVKSIS
jgi:uncharacterized membrane protein HdeD (DUF308 family)